MNKIVNFRYFSALILSAAVVACCSAVSYTAIKVYPRLITPGVSSSNEKVFFDYDYSDEPKPELTIFDMTGRQVKSIQVLDLFPTSSGWRVVWDGRNENGNPVSPGVYIYQWREQNTTTTGSIVVAR